MVIRNGRKLIMKVIVIIMNIVVVCVIFILDDFLVIFDIFGSVWLFFCDIGFGWWMLLLICCMFFILIDFKIINWICCWFVEELFRLFDFIYFSLLVFVFFIKIEIFIYIKIMNIR